MQEIGIAIRAKKDLQAILDSVEALGKIDSQTKKVVESVKDLGKGSQEVRKLESAYKKLEKEIESTGKASKEQLKSWREQQRHLASTAAGLRISQGMGISDYDIEARTARANLAAILKRPDLEPETRFALSTLYKETGVLPRISRAQLGAIQAGGAEGIGRGISGLEAQQREEEARQGAWGRRFKTAGAMVLGGSVAGFLLTSIRRWAELDTELIKIERRFGNIRKSVESVGTGMGFMKRETAEVARLYGQIANDFDRAEVGQLMGFARVRGLGLQAPLQLRQAGRYVGMPEMQRFLPAFERFTRQVGMGKGRMEEAISVTGQLAQQGAQQALGLNIADIMGMQSAAARFWQGIDDERGRGAWGANFLQRLNQGMLSGQSEANRAFYYRAYGWGQPGVTLPSVIERMQAGIFGRDPVTGRSNFEAIVRQVGKEIPLIGERGWIERTLALSGQLPGMDMKTIRQLVRQWREKPGKLEEVFEAMAKKPGRPEDLMQTLKDYELSAQGIASTGEEFKVAIESAQYNLIEGVEGIAKFLKGEGKEQLRGAFEDIANSMRQLFPDVGDIFSGMDKSKIATDSATILGQGIFNLINKALFGNSYKKQ
jgi:hypothetical protein